MLANIDLKIFFYIINFHFIKNIGLYKIIFFIINQ